MEAWRRSTGIGGKMPSNKLNPDTKEALTEKLASLNADLVQANAKVDATHAKMMDANDKYADASITRDKLVAKIAKIQEDFNKDK
jgi:hypothetical protein